MSASPNVSTTTVGSTARVDREEHDIIVALEHAPLVRSVLGLAGVGGVHYDDAPALGLARLGFDNASGLDGLSDGLAKLLVQGTQRSQVDGRADIANVVADRAQAPGSVVAALGDLRAYFELRYARWSPTMGRNRLVGQVTGGGGTVSHGGGPEPEPADAKDVKPDRTGPSSGRVTVGILDTAVLPHPWLAGSVVAAPEAQTVSTGWSSFAAGHGTFVAGLVLQEAPQATLRMRRALEDDGTATSWEVAKAIVELGRGGIDILNLSLVCFTGDAMPPLALATAVSKVDPDVLVVACAGNHGDRSSGASPEDCRKPAWPAALDNVVAVGSAKKSGGVLGYTLADFTPQDAVWIDVVTPGENVVSTYFTTDGPTGSSSASKEFRGWAQWSGTSFSAAKLTGAVAKRAEVKKIPAREAYHKLVTPVRASAATSYEHHMPPFLEL